VAGVGGCVGLGVIIRLPCTVHAPEHALLSLLSYVPMTRAAPSSACAQTRAEPLLLREQAPFVAVILQVLLLSLSLYLTHTDARTCTHVHTPVHHTLARQHPWTRSPLTAWICAVCAPV
jgi:hypothetical protein